MFDISVCSVVLCGPDSPDSHLTENYTDGWHHHVYFSHSGEAAGGMRECRTCPRDGGRIPPEGKLSSGFGCEALCALLVPSELSSFLLLCTRDCCTLQQQHAHFQNTINIQKCRPDPNLTHHKLILEVNFKVPLALSKIFAVKFRVEKLLRIFGAAF